MCRQFIFPLLLALITSSQIPAQSFQQQLFVSHWIETGRDHARMASTLAAANADSDSGGTPEAVYLSPNHISTLRKEASRRIANKRMPIIFLSDSETDAKFTDDGLAAITEAFQNDELVQVRGLSRNNKKRTRAIAESLTQELSLSMNKDVNLVECRGHAAVYYCPFADDENETSSKRIKLFTSVGKKNQWTKKPKPVRDNRGQIIPGLYE
jgi:RNA-binding protein YhbY